MRKKLDKTCLIGLLILFPLFHISAKASKYNDLFYPLFIKGDMNKWVIILNEAKAEYWKKPNPILLEDIVRAQYGLTAYYLGNNQDQKALEEINAAAIFLDKLELYYPNQGWVYALSASFQSFKLIINPFRFFFKGPAILSAINKSYEIAPKQIDALFLKANQTFYMPAFIGGDQQKGLEYFTVLEKEILTHHIKNEKCWMLLLYLTSNALACNSAQKYDEAIRLYKIILSIEPEYLWVKNELLPQSLKKQENDYLQNRKEKVDRKI